jgi:hypothetical protein
MGRNLQTIAAANGHGPSGSAMVVRGGAHPAETDTDTDTDTDTADDTVSATASLMTAAPARFTLEVSAGEKLPRWSFI